MLIEQKLSDMILECCLAVHTVLGPGLPEKVYQKALFKELNLHKRMVAMEKNYRVFYKNELVGDYYADLVVDDKIIIEVKSVSHMGYEMRAQLLNYLNVSGLRVGYLVNFKPVVLNWERVVV